MKTGGWWLVAGYWQLQTAINQQPATSN